MGPHIERSRRGTYRLKLRPEERAVLRSLPAELREILESDDPALRRLFPPAYEDDPERQNEYESLTRRDLLTSKRAALEVMEATAGSEKLTHDELTAWLRAMNDLRLALGTRLDVTEDMDHDRMLEGPSAHAYAVYSFLGWLQEQAVAALSLAQPGET